MTAIPITEQPLDGAAEIEVLDEVSQIVFVFREQAGSSAEQLVLDWSGSGDPTWAAQRPATAQDLAEADAALAGIAAT